MPLKNLKRVLVANRGEIAVRVIHAAKELGLGTVAVYSEADEGALHVRLADKKIALKGKTARESYLNQEKLINAVIQSGADCVHPGYGFFSENAQFAKKVEDEGFTFIGPSSEVIALMGDKNEARKIAHASGVPVVPGSAGKKNPDELLKVAGEIGFPVIIKAAFGGSGRGMRIVNHEKEFREKFDEASKEALAAFGNGEVFIEKYLVRPRHIEVQVFGDKAGNALHFFERECSLQRRHQKVVEEAPATNLHPQTRKRILEAALKLIKKVNYVNAGTLEFLVERGESIDASFYFLEMNTRIQVEHPVTEEVTGVDLVKLQFLVADGAALPFTQEQIRTTGHAIEFRIYGEDPTKNFSPVSGEILYLSPLIGRGIRVDSWVEAGEKLSPYYDSLLLKLTVSGETREAALKRAQRVFSEFMIEGIPTTLGFHRWVLTQEDFLKGQVHIHWINENYHGEELYPETVGPLELATLKKKKR